MTRSLDFAEEKVRDKLHVAGLRATGARIAVYRALRDAGGHHSVDEIVAIVKGVGHVIPRMSVYNVVADLQAAGLVMCADTGPGRALYEVSEIWHHHFVCRACNAVIDVPCARGAKPCLEPPASFRGKVDEAQVIFRGVCAACGSRN